MGAAYSFVSRWRVPAPPERCWAEIERMISIPAQSADSIRRLRPGARPTWWRSVAVARAPARLAVGESLELSVRSPLGYRLHPRLTITDLVAGRRIEVASTGDLSGTGRVDLAGDDATTDITIHWDVSTERAWMNATALVLRPAFAWAHARVMAEGERGLRTALG